MPEEFSVWMHDDTNVIVVTNHAWFSIPRSFDKGPYRVHNDESGEDFDSEQVTKIPVEVMR